LYLTFADYDDMENLRLSLELSVAGVVELNVKKISNYTRKIVLYEVIMRTIVYNMI